MPRRALALAAARLAGAQPETVVAVTGTAGKSRSPISCARSWRGSGATRRAWAPSGSSPTAARTTARSPLPDPVTLHETLARLAPRGRHRPRHGGLLARDRAAPPGRRAARGGGVHQSRPRPPRLSREASRSISLRRCGFSPIFCLPGCPVVVDADGAYADRVIAAAQRARRPVPHGRPATAGPAVWESVRTEGFAQTVLIAFDGLRPHPSRLPLAGEFQVANALVAAGLCAGDRGRRRPGGLRRPGPLPGVPGRHGTGRRARGRRPVFVDYAHKPERSRAC